MLFLITHQNTYDDTTHKRKRKFRVIYQND